jgi:nucleoside-diphosphate-sugar epimerase
MPPRKIANMGKILVAGANGALGQTLIERLGPDVAVAGTRRQIWGDGSFDHVCLANDEAIKALDWRKFRAAINVAGRIQGNMDELTDANVNFPTKLARAAREGGVKQFVQVSSFAVYGSAEYIDDSTPQAPANDYGHTKAEGDRQLHALADDSFLVASLRLPFLFDADRPALFRLLFNAVRMLPYFPVGFHPVMRSMISYSDAALVLRSVVEDRRSGIFHAAAPTPFDLDLLSRLMFEESRFRLRTICIPDFAIRVIRLAAPELYRRLFKSNILSPETNIALDNADIIDIEVPVRALVRQYFQ